GLRGDTRADVHRDAAYLALDHLALAGVQARPHVDSELVHAVRDRTRAPDPARRPVEGREEAVAGRVELAAAVPGELLPHERMVPLDELAPASVPQLDRLRRRADDVGEEDRGEHAVGLGRLPAAAL